LVFNNKIINLLSQRGTHLRNKQTLKVKEIDSKLEKIKLKMMNDENHKYYKPAAAFITFENKEGKERALKYRK